MKSHRVHFEKKSQIFEFIEAVPLPPRDTPATSAEFFYSLVRRTRMAHLISFKTAKFDLAKETPNPINPIAGQGVLRWLRDELAKEQYQCSEPDPEDWGWYIDVAGAGASYLVGASADADASNPIEWIIQVHKNRSLHERLLGRNKMTPDDPLSALIENIVRSDTALQDVSVERDA